VTVGVVASVAFVALRQSSPSFPETFSGLERVGGQQTDTASQAFRSMADAQGLSADMAFYASSGVPAVALMWVDAGGQGASDAAFESFIDGFTTGFAGGSVTGDSVVESVDGVTYRCAPVSGQVDAGVCLWDEGDIVWVLVDARTTTTLDASKELARSVHEAVA
jgi:hypothetical protein